MSQINELFVEAGTLMFAGMVFVFAFLGVLILFINTVLAKLAVAFPDPIAVAQQRSRSNVNPAKHSSNVGSSIVSPAIVAAISAGVTKYRQQHSRQLKIKK